MKNFLFMFLLVCGISFVSCEMQKFEFKSTIQVRTDIDIIEETITATDKITLQDILSELDLEPNDKIKSIVVESIQVNWKVNDNNEADLLTLFGQIGDLDDGSFIEVFGSISPGIKVETISLRDDEGIHRVNTLLRDGMSRLNANLAMITDFCNNAPSMQEFGVSFGIFSNKTPSVNAVVIFNVGVILERCMETLFLTGGEECTDGPCTN